MAREKAARRVRFWHARIWHGMSFWVWARLLARHSFAITPSRLWLLFTVSPVTLINSVLGLVQKLVYTHRIKATELAADPIFVIGHWRSGTTMLHELIMLDEQFITPNTFECMCPHHFLLTSRYADWVNFLVPDKRPMDDMAAGWHKPQEDEFALLNLGVASPYDLLAFTRSQPKPGNLSLEGLGDEARHEWGAALDRFFRQISFKRGGRQLVSKSPTHTARIKTLLKLYPKAKFLLVTRDPHAVFGSTLKLWDRMGENLGLQNGPYPHLEERIHFEFREMTEALLRDKSSVPHGQFHHVRYEDLMTQPLETIGGAYAALSLGEFEPVVPRIETYFAQRADYQADNYQLTDAQKQKIIQLWMPVMEEFGYGPLNNDDAAATSSPTSNSSSASKTAG